MICSKGSNREGTETNREGTETNREGTETLPYACDVGAVVKIGMVQRPMGKARRPSPTLALIHRYFLRERDAVGLRPVLDFLDDVLRLAVDVFLLVVLRLAVDVFLLVVLRFVVDFLVVLDLRVDVDFPVLLRAVDPFLGVRRRARRFFGSNSFLRKLRSFELVRINKIKRNIAITAMMLPDVLFLLHIIIEHKFYFCK